MQRSKAITGFSIAGAVVFGGFMLVGTILLGHMRQMWMELDHTLPCTLLGLFVGGWVGFVIGKQPRA
jgi:prolipoprotein diacylglyceryltransferase